MKLNKVEIDYFEDRKYKDEADKRSQQFREVAGRLNDVIDEMTDGYSNQNILVDIENLKTEIERLKKPNWLNVSIGILVLVVIFMMGVIL